MSARTGTSPVAASDRVSDVLSRDESLVEVFVRAAPQLAKLRNRAMRRVMARLVTIEQVARMAGVSCDALLNDLNTSLGIAHVASPPASAPPDSRAAGPTVGAAVRPTGATEVTLDVRDDLRAGREPFSAIMAAVADLPAGDVLHLRAIFEPLPLYAVLEKRGFSHESHAHADDDWSVWFWRATQANNAPPAATASGAVADRPAADISSDFGPEPNVVWLDVRWMEPPEPLVRTLTALETLPKDHTLAQLNLRVPQFLLPMLAERGYAYDLDESHADYVLVRIWRVT
ncbi:MAG TPA: DUF2249 domain-containing protein [Gemmatimonadaceae bacterium]